MEELTALFLSALTAVFKLDQVFQLKVSSVSATFASPVCVVRSSDPFSGEECGLLSRKGPGNEVGWKSSLKVLKTVSLAVGGFVLTLLQSLHTPAEKKDDPLTKPLTRMETF